MTDEMRKLLELAAKAVGLKVEFRDCDNGEPSVDGEPWNPRDDDGDSRRLQVAAGIDTMHDVAGARAYVGKELFLEWSDDRCEALRMAVLRAAAFKGKAMP